MYAGGSGSFWFYRGERKWFAEQFHNMGGTGGSRSEGLVDRLIKVRQTLIIFTGVIKRNSLANPWTTSRITKGGRETKMMKTFLRLKLVEDNNSGWHHSHKLQLLYHFVILSTNAQNVQRATRQISSLIYVIFSLQTPHVSVATKSDVVMTSWW